MRKIEILFFAILFIVFNTKAQNNKAVANWGDEVKFPKETQNQYLVTDNNSNFVAFSHKYGKTFFLTKFDKDLKLLSQVEIATDIFPKGYNFESLIKLKDNCYILFSTFKKSNDLESLYLQKFDLKNLSFIGSPQLLITENTRLKGVYSLAAAFQSYMADKWHISFSPDSTKILIYNQLVRPPDNNNFDKKGVYVFNDDFQLLSKRYYPMSIYAGNMENERMEIDNTGKVYYFYMDRSGKGSFWGMIIFDKNGKAPVKCDILPPAKSSFFDTELIMINNGIYLCGGYLSYNPNSNISSYGLSGFYMYKYDPTTNSFPLDKQLVAHIPVAIMKYFESKKETKKITKKENNEKKELTVEDLDIKQITVSPDGKFIDFIAEERYYNSSSNGSPGGSDYSYTIHINDIVLLRIDTTGKIIYWTKIPKNQIAKNANTSSWYGTMSFYSTYSKKNELCLFIVDNAKNIDLKPSETPYEHYDNHGGILTLLTIDTTGKVSKFPIMNFETEERQVFVRDFYNIDNSYITFSNNKYIKPRALRIKVE